MTELEVTGIHETRFTVLDRLRGCVFRVDATGGMYSCSCCGNVAGASCRHIAVVKTCLARSMGQPAGAFFK